MFEKLKQEAQTCKDIQGEERSGAEIKEGLKAGLTRAWRSMDPYFRPLSKLNAFIRPR